MSVPQDDIEGVVESRELAPYRPLVACAFLAFFALVAAGAFDFPGKARTFPLVVSVTGLVTCLPLLVGELRSRPRSMDKPAGRRIVRLNGYAFVVVGAYLGMIYVMGYVVATLLIGGLLPLALTPRVLASEGRGLRTFLWSVFFGCILVGAIWLTFVTGLGGRLPEGNYFQVP
jgi:hypothetical protein